MCECKGDELNNVIFCKMELLKHDSSWHWVENVCHIQLENYLVKNALDVMDHCFTITFCGHPKLVGGIHVENKDQNQHAQLVKNRAFASYNDLSFTLEESIVTKF
jgi:hypothetical protein